MDFKTEVEMKPKTIVPAVFWTIATAFAFAVVILTFSTDAIACGYDDANKKKVAWNSNSNSMLQKASLSEAQAAEIVTQHINRLNPDLKLGAISDTGNSYEAEILSTNQERIMQKVGVYKDSGLLVVIN